MNTDTLHPMDRVEAAQQELKAALVRSKKLVQSARRDLERLNRPSPPGPPPFDQA
jgi:hypothetical protein